MATFPALSPQGRTYIPGQHPNTPIRVLTGDETGVRHTNASTGHRLRLLFTGLTTEQHFSVTAHYSLHGRFLTFDIPQSITDGADLVFPANYVWLYAGPPSTEYSPGVITLTVELELVPPYTV
jgi:hypothetical protein